jgi:hypothetical protein
LAVCGTGIVKHFGGLLYFKRLIADKSKSIAKREATGFGESLKYQLGLLKKNLNIKLVFLMTMKQKELINF